MSNETAAQKAAETPFSAARKVMDDIDRKFFGEGLEADKFFAMVSAISDCIEAFNEEERAKREHSAAVPQSEAVTRAAEEMKELVCSQHQ